MKLNKPEKRTLLALRAGDMNGYELNERFPSGHSVQALIRMGLVVNREGIYSITPLGREVCPSRRAFEGWAA